MHQKLCTKALALDRSGLGFGLFIPTQPARARGRARAPVQRPDRHRSKARLVLAKGSSPHAAAARLRVLKLLELGAFEIRSISRMLDLPKETVRRTVCLLEREGRVTRSMRPAMWTMRRAPGLRPCVWALATSVAADRPATPLQPLAPEQRVLAALALGPFTPADLARALALPPEDLAGVLAALVVAGLLRVAHRVEHSRRVTLFSLANPWLGKS